MSPVRLRHAMRVLPRAVLLLLNPCSLDRVHWLELHLLLQIKISPVPRQDFEYRGIFRAEPLIDNSFPGL